MVWIVSEDASVSSVPVDVIQEVEDTVYLRADVADGARLVVSDLAVMTEGMKVSFDSDGGS